MSLQESPGLGRGVDVNRARKSRRSMKRVAANVLKVTEPEGTETYEVIDTKALDASGLHVGIAVTEKSAEEVAADEAVADAKALAEIEAHAKTYNEARPNPHIFGPTDTKTVYLCATCGKGGALAEVKGVLECAVCATARVEEKRLRGEWARGRGGLGDGRSLSHDRSMLPSDRAKAKKRKPITGPISAADRKELAEQIDAILEPIRVVAQLSGLDNSGVKGLVGEYLANGERILAGLDYTKAAPAPVSTRPTVELGLELAGMKARANIAALPTVPSVEEIVSAKLAKFGAYDAKMARIIDAVVESNAFDELPTGYSRDLRNLELSLSVRGFKG